PGPQIFEHLRRAVAVRYESRRQARGLGFLEHRDGPLARDERLVVCADDDARALAQSIADEKFRRCFDRRSDSLRVPQRLRRHPVLAVGAMEIAAEHAKTVSERSRLCVKEGFFSIGSHWTPPT